MSLSRHLWHQRQHCRFNCHDRFALLFEHVPVQELRDVDGTKRDLKIEMDDQSAFLTHGATGSLSLMQALLSTKPERRQRAMSAILKNSTLDLTAFIAARNRDAELAEAVVAIERLVMTQHVDRLLPTISVIVVCAAALTDRKEALGILARRLENLAFAAPAKSLPEALDAFRILQSINDDLSPLLGRAIAMARLAMMEWCR